MSIEINSKHLASQLDALRSVVESRTTLPQLGYVLVESTDEERIRLTATDLDNTLQIEVAHEGNFTGRFCAPLARLHVLVKALPESDIGFDLLPNGWSELTTETGTYKLAGIPVNSFPTIPTGEGQSWELEGKDLLTGLSLVKHHMAREDSQYGRKDVLFEINGCLRFVATASVMTSICEVSPTQPFLSSGVAPLVSWTIPAKATRAMLRTFSESGKVLCWETDAKEGGSLLIFRQGGKTLTTRRSAIKFPDYKMLYRLFPKREVTVDKGELGAALGALAAFTEAGDYKPANFSFGRQEMKVTARTSDNEDAEESVNVGWEDDEEVTLRFDLLQVKGAVTAAPSDVTLLVDEDKPLVINSALDGLKTTQMIATLAR